MKSQLQSDAWDFIFWRFGTKRQNQVLAENKETTVYYLSKKFGWKIKTYKYTNTK